MYRACFRPYFSLSGLEGKYFTLNLSDEVLRELLDGLEKLTTGTLEAKLSAADCKDEQVTLTWSEQLAGFLVTVRNNTAGLVPYDEIQGALGMVIKDDSEPCTVCLSSVIDVHRRGILDLESGTVQVFTSTPGLATHGAHAFLTGRKYEQLDGVRFALDKGEPTKSPLRVPSQQLYRLQQVDVAKAGDSEAGDWDLEKLIALTKKVSDFGNDGRSR